MDTPNDSTTPTKRCTKCGNEFPATLEYFYACKINKNGLTSECRECLKSRSRNWHKQNPDKTKARALRYRTNNYDAVTERSRRYYKNNSSKMNEDHRQRYKDNPDRAKDVVRRYQKAHPETCRQAGQRRRARKRELAATFTQQDWRGALAYFHGCCAYCGRGVSLFDVNTVLHQDHFVPSSKNGAYIPPNIVPACQGCNLSKSDRDALEWLISKYGKTTGTRKHKAIMEYFEKIENPKSH